MQGLIGVICEKEHDWTSFKVNLSWWYKMQGNFEQEIKN